MAGTVTEDRFITPTIETGRIVNINIDSWTVDVKSEFGGKIFFDVQVMTPYFHYANGEGIYVMPEVGAMVWMCKPSDGRFSQPFVLGFQAPFDEENVNFRCRRQNLNPGDIMFRTRDENFIILRRGGVVQIGATPTAQRIFVPIRNFIRDFCENYELFTFGGDLRWIVERTDQTTSGDAPAKLSIRVKELASDPEYISELTIGSHGDNDPTTLKLVVRQSGSSGAELQASLAVTKEGDVSWEVKRNYSVKADVDFSVEAGQDIILKAGRDLSVETDRNISMTATQDMTQQCVNSKIEATTSHLVDCPSIDLGGTGGEPVAKAFQVTGALGALAAAVDTILGGAGTTAISSFLPQIPATTTRAK